MAESLHREKKNYCIDVKIHDKLISLCVSQFPISGGRMEQMIRLKCPYTAEPKWHGRFSDGYGP